MKRREPGQYGDTHYVVENDYQKNRPEKTMDSEMPF